MKSTYRVNEPVEIEVHQHGRGSIEYEAGDEIVIVTRFEPRSRHDDTYTVLLRDGEEFERYDRRALERAVRGGAVSLVPCRDPNLAAILRPY